MANNPSDLAFQNAIQQSNYLYTGSAEAALLAADAAAAAAGSALIVNLTTTTLTSNRALTATSIFVAPGSKIVTDSFNLSGNIGPLGDYQIFDATGSGTITLTKSPCFASWYGCGTGVAANDTAALARAATSMRLLNGTVILPKTLTTNATIHGSVYGTQGVCTFSGVSEYGTIWLTTLTGTTAVIAWEADNFGYLGMGARNIAFVPTNAGPIGSRNAGTCILLSGVSQMTFENITGASYTNFVWGYNNVSGQFTEQHFFRGCYSNLCDCGVRLTKGSGDASFRGWNGYITLGVSAGQIGFSNDSGGAFPYNWDMTFQGTGFGASDVTIADIESDVGAGIIDWLLENQTTGGHNLVMTLGGGIKYEATSFLNVQGGTEQVTGTLGLIPAFNVGTGRGKFGSTRGLAVPPGDTFELPPSVGGSVNLTNSTTGGNAILNCSQTGGIKIVSDTEAPGAPIVSITDGGPGSNYWFVEYVGTQITFKNRYTVDETAEVLWQFTS